MDFHLFLAARMLMHPLLAADSARGRAPDCLRRDAVLRRVPRCTETRIHRPQGFHQLQGSEMQVQAFFGFKHAGGACRREVVHTYHPELAKWAASR